MNFINFHLLNYSIFTTQKFSILIHALTLPTFTSQIANLVHIDKPSGLPLDGQRVLESDLIKEEVMAVSPRRGLESVPKYPCFLLA